VGVKDSECKNILERERERAQEYSLHVKMMIPLLGLLLVCPLSYFVFFFFFFFFLFFFARIFLSYRQSSTCVEYSYYTEYSVDVCEERTSRSSCTFIVIITIVVEVQNMFSSPKNNANRITRIFSPGARIIEQNL